MVYDFSYSDTKEMFEKRMSTFTSTKGVDAEEYWLWDTNEDDLDERERLIFILPLLKFEVDHNMLTEGIKGEIGYYQRVIKAGEFDSVLGDDEKEDVIKDVYYCYEKAFGKE